MDEETRAELEAQLTALYGEGETEEKDTRRKLLFNDDGSVNPFQRIGLRRSLEHRDDAPPERPGDIVPIPTPPPELTDDIPSPVPGYDDRIDLVAAVKARVDILGAVQRWGKEQGPIRVGGRRDGIHIRCPFPAHTDNNPSAWINLDKHTWFCGGCQVGGDQIDFYAAAVHGLRPDDFHGSGDFRKILNEICEPLGIDPDPPASPQPPLRAQPAPQPQVEIEEEAVLPIVEPEIPAAPDNTPPTKEEPTLVALDPDSEPVDEYDPLEEAGLPRYDWQDLGIVPGTFLYQWMEGNTEDLPSVPQEFFIMLGFQAVGLACGHHVQTVTNFGVLNASLMLVLVNQSGGGKSIALERMTDLFTEVDSSRWEPKDGSGIKVIRTPGSPEALLTRMRYEWEDPQDPSKKEEKGITGLLREDELATFISKAGRKGGEHMKQRVMALHDFRKRRLELELVDEDAANATGERPLHDSYFAATFLTQTKTIRTQIDELDMASGFMNRIIPVFGPRRAVPDVRVRWNPQKPRYIDAWGILYQRARARQLLYKVEISNDALQFIHYHPFWILMNSYEDREDVTILSRLKQNCHRMALILAVNENAPEIQARHYDVVLRFVENYIQKCYAMFVSAVKATDSKDVKTRLLEFLHRDYKNTGRWPTRRDLARQRFWRAAPEHVQRIALDNLLVNRQIAMVNLKDGQRTTEICIATDMDGYWASYATMNGKTFNNEKGVFYAHT